jgi:hypothetical protein
MKVDTSRKDSQTLCRILKFDVRVQLQKRDGRCGPRLLEGKSCRGKGGAEAEAGCVDEFGIRG